MDSDKDKPPPQPKSNKPAQTKAVKTEGAVVESKSNISATEPPQEGNDAPTTPEQEGAAEPKDNLSQGSHPKPLRRVSTVSHPSVHSKHKSGSSASASWFRSTRRRLVSFFRPIWKFLCRMFSIPLVFDPISYCRTEDFTASGDRIYNINETENDQNLDMIEATCNYSEATGALFQKVLQDRKESAMNKTLVGNIDFSQVPPWNESMLDRLQCIFQIFDESGDGVIDLEEMSNMMIDFGDKSTDDDKRKVFTEADVAGKGLLTFNEFVMMLHTVTVKSPDSMPQPVVETFRLIDRNMARIRGLDVVQQLQAGLF